MKKLRDLFVVLLVYIAGYGMGFIASYHISGILLKMFVFDIVATVAVFIFSLIFGNSSVYDPYWSFTPIVIAVWVFALYNGFSAWQIAFLAVFGLWGVRLTANWIGIFTDFSYEDWRYRKFREENKPFMWFIINFFGIHMVPTLVVFAGMLPIFEIAKDPLGAAAIPGLAVILFGVAMEFFADREMHAFLKNTKEKVSCKNGLWKYSRHPNYLGEMSVWVGVFLVMIPFAPEKWYYAIGMILVILLFNFISVPMMEKRQLARRADYADYKKSTSRVLLLPTKR